jgi:hypothetical protein
MRCKISNNNQLRDAVRFFSTQMTQMTQMTQIYADLNLCHPRHPRHLCAKLFLTHPLQIYADLNPRKSVSFVSSVC